MEPVQGKQVLKEKCEVYKHLYISVSCGSKDFKQNLKLNSKKTKCRPRDTIVDIKYKGALKVNEVLNRHLVLYSSRCDG